MTDAEIIEHLRRYSSDPDDQSLVYRVDRLAELKTRAGALSPVEERLMRVLEVVNECELYFLRQDTGYRLTHYRPCWPRWHWPPELFRKQDSAKRRPNKRLPTNNETNVHVIHSTALFRFHARHRPA